MQTIYVPNASDADHLAEVVEQMREMGSPTVRAVWQGDFWAAIEGSHRVAAAEALGLPVQIIEVDEDDVISDHDLQDLGGEVTVAEILEYMFRGTPEAAYSVETEEV